MLDPAVDVIGIDDLVKAKRRCVMASFPSWIGRVPALAFAVFSFGSGWDWLFYVPAACAVFAGHSLMLEGRLLGGVLQAAGVGAITAAFVQFMLELRELAYESSASMPAATDLWIFVTVVAALLVWGVTATARHERVTLLHGLPRRRRPRTLRWRHMALLGRTRLKRIASALLTGTTLIGLAVAVSFLLFTHLESLGAYSMTTQIATFGAFFVFIMLSGTWAQRVIFKARRLAELSAEDLLSIDSRTPSLLLRSFKDDLTPLRPAYELGRQYVRKSLEVVAEQLTLEETVCDVLGDDGPVIAIGKPGEALPPVGAARHYVTNEDWREAVTREITRARWIAVILGTTEGLGSEYAAIREMGRTGDTLAVLPPAGAGDLSARWHGFSGATLGMTPVERVEQVLVATFPDVDRVAFITCRERDEDCYELAIRRALVLLRRKQSPVGTG